MLLLMTSIVDLLYFFCFVLKNNLKCGQFHFFGLPSFEANAKVVSHNVYFAPKHILKVSKQGTNEHTSLVFHAKKMVQQVTSVCAVADRA